MELSIAFGDVSEERSKFDRCRRTDLFGDRRDAMGSLCRVVPDPTPTHRLAETRSKQVSAIANHASKSSLIGDHMPTALVERTWATISASSRSACSRVPRLVAVLSIRRPVLGSVPMNTRSSQEPALR